MNRIYLDNAATTPMEPAVLEAMMPYFTTHFGNPSSIYSYGRECRMAIENARKSVAKTLNAHPAEIFFTSGGTESSNTAISAAVRDLGCKHIITSVIEHHATTHTVEHLFHSGEAALSYVKLLPNGHIDLDDLEKLLAASEEKCLVTLMHANNETGVIQPLREVVEIAGEIPVHSDAVQSFKKIPLSFKDLGLYAMSLSAHKIGGPLGVGALILRRTVEIPALLHGGGQEREIRSGTFNAPSIVGFAAAAKSAYYDAQHVQTLRDAFISGVMSAIPDASINGLNSQRLPGIVNVTFPGTQSDSLLLLMDGQHISCSTGSACSAGVHEASHVLLAMGHSQLTAQSSLRFSFGAVSTQADVDHVLSALPDVITRGRAANLS